MKKFSKFLEEISNTENMSESDETDSDINANLAVACTQEYSNVYSALNQIRKVLACYDIALPIDVQIIADAYGTEIFKLEPQDNHFLYFAYVRNDFGYYTICASLVNNEELNDLLGESLNEEKELDYYCITPALLLRLMEYAKETIKEDLEIHLIVDKLNELNDDDKIFTSEDYEKLIK